MMTGASDGRLKNDIFNQPGSALHARAQAFPVIFEKSLVDLQDIVILLPDTPVAAYCAMALPRHFFVSAVKEMMHDVKNCDCRKRNQGCYHYCAEYSFIHQFSLIQSEYVEVTRRVSP